MIYKCSMFNSYVKLSEGASHIRPQRSRAGWVSLGPLGPLEGMGANRPCSPCWYLAISNIFPHSHMIHGAAIFTYITGWFFWGICVGKYSSTMDHMGFLIIHQLISGGGPHCTYILNISMKDHERNKHNMKKYGSNPNGSNPPVLTTYNKPVRSQYILVIISISLEQWPHRMG